MSNVNVANPFGLDKQAVTVAVSHSSGAAVARKPQDGTNPNLNTFSFANQNPVGLADIKSAQVSFILVPRVTLDGTGLPSKFTLTTFTVDGVVSDADSSGNGSTVALTQATTSGRFLHAAGGRQLPRRRGHDPACPADETTDPQLQTLLDIVTGGPTPNTATLTLNAASPDLPNGTLLHLTFDTTTLTVSAGQ